ncbi:hypothetical protein CEXT_309981 [Caerostris extrusa]|uniref:Uncharacterized protein n=1 Tax=Caerostris extrusa TaxID=172846 RepID=A0AAV4PAC3_CAEEX|nr:hypothetical protein CEXT_309981 [Caerostris extrusa]
MAPLTRGVKMPPYKRKMITEKRFISGNVSLRFPKWAFYAARSLIGGTNAGDGGDSDAGPRGKKPIFVISSSARLSNVSTAPGK